jgi:hypothetical protein
MDLSFTIAAGLRQRIHSQVWVPWASWPHFPVSDSRLPQPGGSGPCIYVPQERGGPVIPPGTGFPFRPDWIKIQSYFTTGSLPPISSSWHQAPWDPRPGATSEMFQKHSIRIFKVKMLKSRSQWPSCLRHELSSLAQTLGRGFECHSKHGCLCALILCVGRGLATGWSLVQVVLPTVYKIKKLKKRRRPIKGL